MNHPAERLIAGAVESFQSGMPQRAEAILQQVLRMDGNNLAALQILALIKITQKQAGEAIPFLKKVVRLNPADGSNYFNLAKCLEETGSIKDALINYENALRLSPGNPSVLLGYSLCLSLAGRYQEALKIVEDLLALEINFLDAWLNKGGFLKELGKLEDALAAYEKCIQLDPRSAMAHFNKGVLLEYMNDYQGALACYDAALSIDPSERKPIWNKSLLQLTLGNYLDGWKAYEYRWTKKQSNPVFYQEFPKLESLSSVAGKKIVIWCEQGFGDSIQFCRYLPLLRVLGGHITFAVQAPLMALMASLDGVDQLVEVGKKVEGQDFQCALMSLPALFETTVDTIPNNMPYLFAQEDKEQKWILKLIDSKKLRVGLVWSGGFRPNQPELWAVNERRNIPLEKIARLQHIAGVDFFSLQKGDPAESELLNQKTALWPSSNLFNFVSELKDFSDTAALIQQLDLVIAVDTSTAHLAAALGKPVWLLNRYDSCWRWLKDRVDSPWYPSVKLYTQSSMGDWDGVLEKVIADLNALALEH